MGTDATGDHRIDPMDRELGTRNTAYASIEG